MQLPSMLMLAALSSHDGLKMLVRGVGGPVVIMRRAPVGGGRSLGSASTQVELAIRATSLLQL